MLKLSSIDWQTTLFSFNDFLLNKKYQIIQSLLILVVGFFLAKLFTSIVVRLFEARLKPQVLMVVEKLCYYIAIIIVIIISLQRAGIDLKVLLGAAGIFTVAIGFASQTSASNLISGLFLLGERPFVVGDCIDFDGIKGEILSIDLLSTRLRTFDNLMVRVPNESLLKSRFVNLTHFPIRRIDLFLTIDYSEPIDKIRQILLEVVSETYLCLNEPIPRFIILALDELGVKIQFSVWSKKENFDQLKTLLYEKILSALTHHGVTIPYPHRIVVEPPKKAPMTGDVFS